MFQPHAFCDVLHDIATGTTPIVCVGISIVLGCEHIKRFVASSTSVRAFVMTTRTRHTASTGSKGKLIIGNALDLPMSREWETYSKWAKEYGTYDHKGSELVYLKVFGQGILFVNSRRLSYEVFDKRATNYSDRPTSTMLNELFGMEHWALVFFQYTDKFIHYRRQLSEWFGPKTCEAYKPAQLQCACTLLYNIFCDPKEYSTLFKHFAGSVIMQITYGICPKSKEDPYLEVAERLVLAIIEACVPGAFLVEVLPILRYVPAWVPCTRFQRKARVWRQYANDVLEVPYCTIKDAMVTGTAEQFYVRSSLENAILVKGSLNTQDEETIKQTAAILYLAGTDTVAGALKILLLAMALNPDVQRKAQQELDAVLGGSRRPEFDDRSQLPYIAALCKETIRWHPVSPVAFPHATAKDDVFDGYFIPKGTLVFGNAW
ncbi:hypothetical protein M422DRAFT_263541 [Sphaerobolus stellatus SS14]|uniref:Cytochrome P450 n=1 Tax=Sphaerobolus stellatus (strain SS14) TaxID=990650 RepID=A0A0C9UHT4_SPHS4|nr:hypothetical protein M422DRAFT_263541 [Sphaerobolus stellatus SS14]